MYVIDYNDFCSVKSFNSCVRFLVLHYTATNFERSRKSLTDDNVIIHYLVPDISDESYIQAGFKSMRIFNLVDEHEPVSTVGVNSWAKCTNINDMSIGIKIVNLATDKDGIWHFPPYPDVQIATVKQLAANIIQRHPDISPTNVVAHSDIAPTRMSDPGPEFPWLALHEVGIGAWYDMDTKVRFSKEFTEKGIPTKAELISHFSTYGYDATIASTDSGYQYLVRAFQLHFRANNFDGNVDIETAAILYALVEKYFLTV
ncbi:N-acetylmuramoyl-L-alanine amidase [Yersinia massiliensis]|uniref:N-acetylmuramoyl-L-alanine amidase n=1 Tax=Yersinia massiliensis TaxID=419257 RepID=UPI0011A9DDA6|nr:N-acetylmuramoyl-L-alanine amidase [Yersinia massiliensis]